MIRLDFISRKLLRELINADASAVSSKYLLKETNIFKKPFSKHRYHDSDVVAAFNHFYENGILDEKPVKTWGPDGYTISYVLSYFGLHYFSHRRFYVFISVIPWTATTLIALVSLIVSIKSSTAIDLLRQLLMM